MPIWCQYPGSHCTKPHLTSWKIRPKLHNTLKMFKILCRRWSSLFVWLGTFTVELEQPWGHNLLPIEFLEILLLGLKNAYDFIWILKSKSPMTNMNLEILFENSNLLIKYINSNEIGVGPISKYINQLWYNVG